MRKQHFIYRLCTLENDERFPFVIKESFDTSNVNWREIKAEKHGKKMSILKRSRGQRIILSNFPVNCPPIGSLAVIIVDAGSSGFSCAVGLGAWDRCRNPPAGPACLSPMIRAGARANVGNALLMTEPPFHPSPRIKRSPSHLSRRALAPLPALPRPEKRQSRDSAVNKSEKKQ